MPIRLSAKMMATLPELSFAARLKNATIIMHPPSPRMWLGRI